MSEPIVNIGIDAVDALRPRTDMQLALADLRMGVFGLPVWWFLAWHDIKQRYRRSLLGPFWLTISTGVMVAAMGPLYGMLFNQPTGSYFRHLAVSIVAWTFVASSINDSCSAFIAAEGFIKEVRLPFVVHLMRVLARNLIMLGHNLIVAAAVLIFFPPDDASLMALAVPGLILVMLNLFWLGSLLALLCARFRDIPQIVGSVIQVAFFLTPIVWKADMLRGGDVITKFNPLYHLVEVIRTPLLGESPDPVSWIFLVVTAVLGFLVTFAAFSRYRSRIAYWV